MPTTPTCDRCSAICARTWAWIRTRSTRTAGPGTPRRCARNGSAARRPDGVPDVNPAEQDLIARSNSLGADPATTNYAGGNTSVKATATDPVTGGAVELLRV